MNYLVVNTSTSDIESCDTMADVKKAAHAFILCNHEDGGADDEIEIYELIGVASGKIEIDVTITKNRGGHR